MENERIRKILLAIIKHCKVIEETKKHFGNDYNKFEENPIYQNAILTPVTQIGELVKRLPIEFRKEYEEIPWKSIAGMRDIVVHNYDTIDKVILWNVADKETKNIMEFCNKLVR